MRDPLEYGRGGRETRREESRHFTRLRGFRKESYSYNPSTFRPVLEPALFRKSTTAEDYRRHDSQRHWGVRRIKILLVPWGGSDTIPTSLRPRSDTLRGDSPTLELDGWLLKGVGLVFIKEVISNTNLYGFRLFDPLKGSLPLSRTSTTSIFSEILRLISLPRTVPFPSLTGKVKSVYQPKYRILNS